MKKFLILFAVVAIPFFSSAQRWKGYRYELIYGAGATSFLGELGGANYIGTHQFRDLEWRATRPCAFLGFRYKISEHSAFRPGFSYGYVMGKDAWTQEPYRHYRNLSFGSHIIEFAINYEWSFMKEQMGRKYRMRGVKGRRGYEIYTYFFGGLGMFYYNPTAKDENGVRKKLRKLHTEGQTLVGTRKQYGSLSVCIPLGIAFKYTVNKKLSLALEYGIRYTFTDYIDDVSKTYVDKDLLAKQPNGQLAVKMANRTPNTPGNEHITAPGAQRGNPKYNDAYMFGIFSLNYKLKTTKTNLPKF